MTDKASDAANGSERAARVFKTMGISVTDANGALRSQEEMLGDIADKFKTGRPRSRSRRRCSGAAGGSSSRCSIRGAKASRR